MNFEQIIADYKEHKDDPDWISNACVEVAAYLFTHNTNMAKAELLEKQSLVALLTQTPAEGEKKLSVAESENRAVVNTQNHYGILKAQSEAVIEFINALKTRSRVLEGERKQA